MILREEALLADGMYGPVLPEDVLPSTGKYAEQIAPLYVAWLLTYLDELRLNGWPNMPVDDNHTDRAGMPNDPKVTALVFASEIATRIEKCGRDGEMALMYYKDGVLPDDIVTLMGLMSSGRKDRQWSADRVCRCIKKAVLYCAGRRKRESYEHWKGRRSGRFSRRNVTESMTDSTP